MNNNSFAGTNLRVGNHGVRSIVGEMLDFRAQVTRTDWLRQLGGWDHGANQMFAEGLGHVRKTLAHVTYNERPAVDTGASATGASAGQRERELERQAEAIDENATLLELFRSGEPLSVDDVAMPASFQAVLPYDLTGANPDFPQMSDPKFKNNWLKQFIAVLDIFVRDATTLACAPSGSSIPQRQSVMLHNHLETAFAILQVKGGPNRAAHVVNGTDPESFTDKVGTEVKPVEIANGSPDVAPVGP
jgi:hypothetical protein